MSASTVDVSVVVPAFNARRTIADTLASILGQRGVAFEVIVVDDCSTDGTRTVVERIAAADPRVRCLCTPANFGGPAGPRNLGVEASHSEWIALCDADDLWHPDKLALQCDCARETGAALVSCAIEDFADGQRPATLLDKPPPQSLPIQRLTWRAMMLKNRIATSSVLCRRDALRAAGGFDTDRRLIAVEDYDLWLRLLARRDVIAFRICEPLVAYRRTLGSISTRKGRQALKVLHVLQLSAVRQGWGWLFPFAAPLLMLSYLSSSLVLRRWGGRL